MWGNDDLRDDLCRRLSPFMECILGVIRVVDPDPDLSICIRIRILPSSSKNRKKNLDLYSFVTSL
jgi:hypothetical protein